MALVTGDVIQLSWRGTHFGQRIILTHAFVLTGDAPAGQTIQQDLADMLTFVSAGGAADIQTPYLALLPATYTLNETRAQRLNAPRSAYTSNFPVGAVGTHASAATVACDSAALTLRGPLADRHNTGTKKIGPCPDGASAAGLLTAGYTTLVGALGTAMLMSGVPALAWALTTVFPCIYDRVNDQVVIPTSFRVGATSRIMSRRVVGRGE